MLFGRRQRRKVRYALVGAGNIAQMAVLPAFEHASENSELVAIVSGDPQKRAELGKRYRVDVTGTYEDLESILERAHVDAVFIATPNSQHRELTERAARAGVHVLCEKPMAGTVEDCEAMIEACREHGVLLMVAYRLHFEEANLRAIEVVRSGEIGEPRIFTSVFTMQVRPGDIRTKAELLGGAVYDLGIYPINAARYLFRDEPIDVFAAIAPGGDERFDEVDQATSAIMRFPGGRVAQFTVSLGAASLSSYRVIGTKGDLLVEPAYDYEAALEHHLTVEDKAWNRSFKKRDQFAPELVSFSKCILEGTEPEPSGEEGLCDIRVVEAIFASARTGRAVAIPPSSRRRRPDLGQEMHKPPVKAPKPVNAPSPTIK